MFLHNYIPNPILLDLGFYQIRWYGLILALAVAGGFFILARLRRYGQAGGYGGQVSDLFTKDNFFNLLFWVAIWGIIGGRLVHVLTFFDYYWQRPLQILAIWNGGIAFYGVFAGGLIAAGVLTRRVILSEARIRQLAERAKPKDSSYFPYDKGEGPPAMTSSRRSRAGIHRSARNDKKNKTIIHHSLFIILDALVVGLAFGQFIGRWGNWFNQELFGGPTNLPWGIPIDIWHRPVGLENFTYFHPIFLYESLFSLVLFLGLYFLYKKIHCHFGPRPGIQESGSRIGVRDDKAGFVFSAFLIFHSTARFFLEFLRLDAQPEFLGLCLFQWVAIIEFILGWVVYFYVRVWYNKSKLRIYE
ncbi:MAG: prolipoprotein diacylglyceryl transferase [Patescibacteria group bacterium]|nr:prolipoprotein diacylglyceryl transferase [Patescibacteria group bacterium]